MYTHYMYRSLNIHDIDNMYESIKRYIFNLMCAILYHVLNICTFILYFIII